MNKSAKTIHLIRFIFLTVTLIAEILPIGAAMVMEHINGGYGIQTFSYFSMIPLWNGNPFYMLTGILTALMMILTLIGYCYNRYYQIAFLNLSGFSVLLSIIAWVKYGLPALNGTVIFVMVCLLCVFAVSLSTNNSVIQG